MNILSQKIKHFLCYLKSDGQHRVDLDDPELYGDKYCPECGVYKYTEYDQALAVKDRKNWFKMWWQSED